MHHFSFYRTVSGKGNMSIFNLKLDQMVKTFLHLLLCFTMPVSSYPHPFSVECTLKHLDMSFLVRIYLRPSVWSSRRAALHWLHIVKCLPSGQPPSIWSPLHCRSRQAGVWRPGLSRHVSCSGCPSPTRSPLW